MEANDVFTMEFALDRIGRFINERIHGNVKLNELVWAFLFGRILERKTGKVCRIGFELRYPPRKFHDIEVSDENAIGMLEQLVAQDSEIDFFLAQEETPPIAFQVKRFFCKEAPKMSDFLVFITEQASVYSRAGLRTCHLLMSIESIEDIDQAQIEMVATELKKIDRLSFESIFFAHLDGEGSVIFGTLRPKFYLEKITVHDFRSFSKS